MSRSCLFNNLSFVFISFCNFFVVSSELFAKVVNSSSNAFILKSFFLITSYNFLISSSCFLYSLIKVKAFFNLFFNFSISVFNISFSLRSSVYREHFKFFLSSVILASFWAFSFSNFFICNFKLDINVSFATFKIPFS